MVELAVTALSEGAKMGCKVGSKIVCCIGGTLLSYGVSQAILPQMKKSMEKKMETEEFKKLSPEEQKKAVDMYNIKATTVNGACNAVGTLAMFFADTAICKGIDKTSITNNYTIGNNYLL